MATTRDLVTKAMRKAGILGRAESPTADEVNDGVSDLNNMLGSWSNDSLNIVARAWESFTLQSGVASYNIGINQTFNTARPLKLVDAYYLIGGTSYPLSIIDDESYNAITFKGLNSLPDSISYDNGYPVGILRLYPVPASDYTIHILTEKPLTEFTVDQELDLAPGVERAIIYNLAGEMAPEYEVALPPEVIRNAALSLKQVHTQIERARGKDWEVSGGGANQNNIFTGWYNA